MNKHFRKVLEVLKTRKEIKALGFSRKELKGIAAKVADKLDLEDDASDEDVEKAINDEVEAVIPFLQTAQSLADRRLQEYKDAHPADDDDDDDDDDPDDEPEGGEGRKSPSKKGKKGKGNQNESAMEKMMNQFTETLNGLKNEISELKSSRTADSRKARVKAIVKDTGKFGERVLKSFARMSFKDDEEFEEYLDEIQEELDAENQERANKGLEKLGTPPATGGSGSTTRKDDKDEVMSDDEVKELAKG